MKIALETKNALDHGFAAAFGRQPRRYFSAPGRTEIGGNHTDHQLGRVLAAAVELEILAAVDRNDGNRIRIQSQGYSLCEVDLQDLQPRAGEENTTAALVRGVAAAFAARGCKVRGFDAYVTSTVLPGSGLSSSAALEVLLGTVCNSLFFDNALPPQEIAKIGQWAENFYFGKPCGLMDQMASAVGGLIAMDFADPAAPEVRPVDFDFDTCGHRLCIIDTHASHADLTEEYAAVPGEMKAVAACFGQEALSRVDPAAFYKEMAALRQTCGDRAVLRAIHYFEENSRVSRQVSALEKGDFHEFLELVKESGRSSFMYLQNVTVSGSVAHQEMALTLALCEKLLQGRGACRVHGGGFAGTVQAFVPCDLVESFRRGVEEVLGQGSCLWMNIRPYGGVELEVQP